ncbi:dynamin family protein [Crocosphaera sp. UHCC 0190]|uniref:dynamin family protein n=1 Tax=Crocosphaera sp. UHCC 0190 TaxID=3110246 RepID=UPI002B1F5D04|nr:dynamin family protein [Crocosphaera sp. UHCC 0190]MEA5510978.1 dynamin family protein [Crocosphaera sp. UHCC 0190]
MEQSKNFLQVSNAFKKALDILEIEETSQLKKDIISLCNYLENPTFRIAVFGPFNYGKSTLLNALLGNKTLPIDLIPTTGAAIYVKYGEKLSTKITLIDGTIICEEGTDILKKYAILNDQRYMRDDVKSVEVYCEHPLLKMGVEFIDLPGTNDREEQDNLVKDKLLTADLIIQVVDGRKLMTLGERENFRDWLLNRGINSVVLVVNFLNLLESEDQKEVYHRLRFVAENFRVNLPPGISNLYRVDALPALRARLKGDNSAAQTTGLSIFESALQSIVTTQKESLSFRISRLVEIRNQLKIITEDKQQIFTKKLEKEQQKIEIQKKAIKIIKQGFQRSLSEFESWLYLPKILTNYQTEMSLALEKRNFKQWHQNEFESKILAYKTMIMEWVDKACEFFEHQPLNPLIISFPEMPKMSPPAIEKVQKKSIDIDDIAAVGVPTGIGWVLGGPVGAAVLGGASYLLNKTTTKTEQKESQQNSHDKISYNEIAKEYLTRFSEQAFLSLRQYEQQAEKIMILTENKESVEMTQLSHQLQLLNDVLAMLDQPYFNSEK